MKRFSSSCARLFLVVISVGVAAVLGLPAVPARALTIDLVTVGNAGNANDPATGNLYGGVAYDFRIGMFHVTIGQYTEFLNAVAADDTNSLYNANMATNLNVAGISRAGSSGSFTYSVMTNGGNSSNRPITYVSWFDSARFANWMANGQPTGAQTTATTENGAYNLANWQAGYAPAKNTINPNTGTAPTFFIPKENEWYKAAYYSPALNGGTGGYYTYATQSNTAPGNVPGSGSNQANYLVGSGTGSRYSVTQSRSYSSSQNYLTDVGIFLNSPSYYGTFDQSGNVYQWHDYDGSRSGSRGFRGGLWRWTAAASSSSNQSGGGTAASEESYQIGFRLAAPVAVPEPSTCMMALAGLACGGYSMFRRRRAR